MTVVDVECEVVEASSEGVSKFGRALIFSKFSMNACQRSQRRIGMRGFEDLLGGSGQSTYRCRQVPALIRQIPVRLAVAVPPKAPPRDQIQGSSQRLNEKELHGDIHASGGLVAVGDR
jgi:hypothetical protein